MHGLITDPTRLPGRFDFLLNFLHGQLIQAGALRLSPNLTDGSPGPGEDKLLEVFQQSGITGGNHNAAGNTVFSNNQSALTLEVLPDFPRLRRQFS